MEHVSGVTAHESQVDPANLLHVTGPQGFSISELGRYGLGVIVRVLRFPGRPLLEPLRRLYCLPCGSAVAHEPLIAEWWICGRGCNAEDADAPLEGRLATETE